MLDNSGSMTAIEDNKASRWQNLMQAVSGFISTLKKDKLLMDYSKITIITHNGTAKLEFENKAPSRRSLMSITGPGGSNDFDAPLIMAKGLMDKYDQ